MAQVSDHSIHYQVYTDFKFIGICDYINLPSHYLWNTTQIQKNLLLLLALQSLVDLGLFCNCPLLFSVLRHLQFLILANHCSCWVVFGVLSWFPASQGYQDTYFLRRRVVSLTPNPQLGGPGCPI
jgi:hypothetical protein